MKVLIMGGQGMVGHMLVRYLKKHTSHTIYYTTRDRNDSHGLFADARDWFNVEYLLELLSPHIVVNCIGILNHYAEQDQVNAYWINGILPHRLKYKLNEFGGKLIQISSDCVFEGLQGGHVELDIPDGTSVYARSKALGEVTQSPHLTIRTSIIGPEIRKHGIGLMQWLLQQHGEIKGYSRVIWNGVTTIELAKFIRYVIEDQSIDGLFHLTAPNSISKYSLLKLLQKKLRKSDITIIRDSGIKLNRTLLSTRTDIQYAVPDYKHMISELLTWM
jgi:dTDP-4-dehydrorhamnose reductase